MCVPDRCRHRSRPLGVEPPDARARLGHKAPSVTESLETHPHADLRRAIPLAGLEADGSAENVTDGETGARRRELAPFDPLRDARVPLVLFEPLLLLLADLSGELRRRPPVLAGFVCEPCLGPELIAVALQLLAP